MKTKKWPTNEEQAEIFKKQNRDKDYIEACYFLRKMYDEDVHYKPNSYGEELAVVAMLRFTAQKLDQYATQRTAEVWVEYQLPEEGDCFVCGKRTNQFHGNLSLAPVEIPYYDNGVRTKRIYHQGCIQEILTQPLPEPPKNSEDEKTN